MVVVLRRRSTAWPEGAFAPCHFPLKCRAGNADVCCIAAAPDSGVTGSELFDAVSPELVLVDSDLATRARARLPNPDDTLALPASTPSDPDATLTLPLPLPASILPDYDGTLPTQSKPRKPRVFPVSFPDNGDFLEAGAASDALQRMMESTADSEVLGSRASSRRHVRRLTTLMPTSSAAAATTLLLVQLYLDGGGLG